MEMGKTSTMGIRRTENMHVLWTGATTTRFREKVLPPSRHVVIRRGRHTLAGGKTPYTNTSQATQTHSTPHSILLGHIYLNQKKL